MVMAEGDPDMFQKFSRMPIYDFNFRILALKKNQKSQARQNIEPFGIGRKGATED